ncbi:MAG TPA: O-methyltransferase [Gemmatimonadaceae bacterium]|nr:O-methyltransferase [Gemmatimonadaceae bacterium]
MDPAAAYLDALFAPEDDALVAMREAADRSGLPPTSIAPGTGRLLQVLLESIGARRVLEIGTLAGYSATWLARALPADGGRVTTVEVEERHAAFARRQLAHAGVGDRVEVVVGRALDVMPSFDGERFDAVFLDADAEPLPTYLEWSVRLLRPGGLLLADNALRGGRVLDPRARDAATTAVREFHRRLATDRRLSATVVATADGLVVARVR